MNDERYLALLFIPVFIAALFFWQTWNDSRHHHRWGKWGEPFVISGTRFVTVFGVRDPSSAVEIQALLQRRSCDTCGLVEDRRLPEPRTGRT